MIKDMCALQNSICQVLESDGIVRGYVCARIESFETNILHIVNLAVDPLLRRQGCGKMLLRGILEHGLDAGCEWAYLEVRTANLAAIRLYRKAGFQIFSKRAHYYEDGSDAYEMGAAADEALMRLGEKNERECRG